MPRVPTEHQSTYITHSGEVKHETVLTRYIHLTPTDIANTPGHIQVTYTIRGEKQRYMAFARAHNVGGTTNVDFSGNSLWNHPKLPLSELHGIIESITGLSQLKKHFEL